MVYLASPGFPASSSSGDLCSCTLQGSKLRVEAVQVSVAARLPWQADVTDGSDYEAVLAIRSKGNTLFKSNGCADCTTVNSINTLLVATGLQVQAVSEVTITYSDFGLLGQNVWLEITESGPDLNISCQTTPLPTNRIITTTTTPTTTTSTTASATTAPATTTSTTMPAAAPPTGPGVPPVNPTTQRPQKSTTDRRGGPRGGTRSPVKDSGGGSGDSATLVILVVVVILLLVLGVVVVVVVAVVVVVVVVVVIVVVVVVVLLLLVVVVIVLLVVVVVLVVIVVVVVVIIVVVVVSHGYTSGFELPNQDTKLRRGQCQADGKKGIKPMIQACLRDLECCSCFNRLKRRSHDSQDSERDGAEPRDFDGAAVASGGDIDRPSQPTGFVNGGFSDDDGKRHSGKLKHVRKEKNVEVVQTEDGNMTIFHNEVYQAHRELVEGEVARMKQHKREQRAQGLNRTLDVTGSLDHPPPADNLHNNASTLDNNNCKEKPQGVELYDQEYAAIQDHDYEPIEHKLEKHPSSCSESIGNDTVPDHLYADVKAANNTPSHMKHIALSKETYPLTDQIPVTQPPSRHKFSTNNTSDSAHTTLNGATGRTEPPLPSNNKKGNPSHDLLSPEERDMFAALGLSGGGTVDPSPDLTTSNLVQSRRRGGFGDSIPQPATSSGDIEEQYNNSTQNSEKLYTTSSKTKKAPTPELVSDILELSLRNIKGKRRGQGSDEENREGDSDAKLEEDEEEEEEGVHLGSQEGQVQMSEC
ncbi:hypothetical protein ElyMa_003111200 [Elysia marginata]|uniref:Uncharacterized protein n=1 Tax=Elysia marginata TaxID=1093978 RepID=A0AAV4IQ18_9GAST|nr:hypothetical protein ElyMa_003111200 [Elysia marginata]